MIIFDEASTVTPEQFEAPLLGLPGTLKLPARTRTAEDGTVSVTDGNTTIVCRDKQQAYWIERMINVAYYDGVAFGAARVKDELRRLIGCKSV
jgi:hypothetical protein